MKKHVLTIGLVLLAVGVGGVAWMASSMKPGIEVSAEAPPVTLISADGSEQPLSQLRGKFVLLDFWSST